MQFTKTIMAAFSLATAAAADPISLRTCQTGCTQLGRACYAAAGFTVGTCFPTTGLPASIIGCNMAFQYCWVGCNLISR